ncbi:MAG: iron ABC transporter permease [Oscillospiraceae bacterium]|nr:iron ABC transporter permease [Oscillospiraceae bacterium]
MHSTATGFRPRMAVLAVIFLLTFFSAFFIGRYQVSAGDLFDILSYRFLKLLSGIFDFNLKTPVTWTSQAESVIINVRLPRVTAAAVVGAALSVAGASYQGMFRNPMVSPDILGASTGAGFGAALAILLSFNYIFTTLSAFAFGLVAVTLAWAVSRVSKLNTTLSMVLAGIMVSSLFSAGTSFIKLVADTEEQLPAITYWLMGSLNSIKSKDALFVIVLVIIPLVPLMLLRWRINLLTISEDEARSLGINTGRLRLVVIICATLMTSASVSVSGMIGWVGLVIPHFCRLIFGYDYRRLIPAAALMGASFLILVDDLSRTISTSEVPLGVLTAFIGAPVFVYLILIGGADREH